MSQQRKNFPQEPVAALAFAKRLWLGAKISGYKPLNLDKLHTKGDKVSIRCEDGFVFECSFGTAIKFGTEGLRQREKSARLGLKHSGVRKLDGELQSYINNRFKTDDVQVITVSTRSGIRKVKLRRKSSNQVAWLRITDLRNRSLVGSLFEDTREAVRKSRKANKEKRLAQYVEEKLEAFGLLDFFRFSSFSKGIIRLLWQAEGLEIPISEYSYRYECRVSNDVLKRAFAWKRFKLTVPLPYTDKEWKDKILQASNGNVEPVGGYPLRRKNNRYELRCLRCSLQFSKARLFNKKHSVIRCPECDSKQDKRYSKEAIRWLEDLEKRFGLSIRKGTSPKGEYAVTLDGKTSKVDGYSKKGNMVFEYHGSRWHGNPLVFYLDETPQFRDKGKSTKQLLVATLKREEQIQKLGFNLIRIWDQDFLDEGRYSQWLLRNSKRIQKFLSPQ